VRDGGYGASRLIVQHHRSLHQVHPFDDFMDISDTTHPNLVSRTGFPTRLKSKKVEISKEKTSQMIVKEKLSERAVLKERRLG